MTSSQPAVYTRTMQLGVQLYTLRDLMDVNPEETLAQVRSCGFRFVETAGLHGLSASKFRDLLESHDLAAVSSHVGLDELENDLDEVVRRAKTLGVQWIVVPWLNPAEYEPGWDRVATRLTAVAEQALGQGLRLAYHNHDFEFEQIGASTGFDVLWGTASETLECELDVYWVHHAGHDPSQWLRNLAGRVPLVHFKDGKQGSFTPVGQGELEWPPIIESAKLAGVEYAIVELDECPSDPIACIQSSLDFLVSLGLEP